MTTPPQTQWIDAAQVQAMIDEQLAALSEQHQADMQSVRAELETARAANAALVQTFVPENAGGVGTAIHETWSQAEQEALRAAQNA